MCAAERLQRLAERMGVGEGGAAVQALQQIDDGSGLVVADPGLAVLAWRVGVRVAAAVGFAQRKFQDEVRRDRRLLGHDILGRRATIMLRPLQRGRFEHSLPLDGGTTRRSRSSWGACDGVCRSALRS